MLIKNELKNYEIGGIGEIKKHTLRFDSYRIGKESGKLTIYAEFQKDKPPKIFKGYPSGQELLIELCNLNLELRGKSDEECAKIIIDWSVNNIHPYYFERDDVKDMEFSKDSSCDILDMIVNVLECYYINISDMVRDLENLYTHTMTVFAIRSLLEDNILYAQRIYADVSVSENKNLIKEWSKADEKSQYFVITKFIDKIPKLKMELQFDPNSKQMHLTPSIKSVIDAAYYGLSRFMAVNTGMIEDYGGKVNIAFCQACGRAFVKRGNRQKYCGTPACQSIRNSNKSRDYYYRQKLNN